MNAVFLGGNSKRHEAWIEQMADILGSRFDSIYVHHYRHWQTEEPFIDMEYEQQQLAGACKSMEPFIVFAKSIGTMLTLKSMSEGIIQPKGCLFLGLPLNAMTDMQLPADVWLKSVTAPLSFMHNSKDPYGSSTELQQLLADSGVNAHVAVLESATHDYNDTVVMSDALEALITRS